MLRSSRPAPEFTPQQLKQLRAQCAVFVAFRNNREPKKQHLEIALGECPEQGGGGRGGGDRRGAGGDDSQGETASSSASQASSSAGLPPPDLAALSSLRLSSPRGGARRLPRRGPYKRT